MPFTPAKKQRQLECLREAWGFAELVRTTHPQSGWTLYIVRNYTGPWLRINTPVHEHGLPGNPRATRVIEHQSCTEEGALKNALMSLRKYGGRKALIRALRKSA